MLRLAPNLREVHDVAGVSAAKLVGEVAAVARFRSRHAFARHNGTARANPSNPSSRTGRTRKETIRSLKRRRSGVVDRAMLADAQIAIETHSPTRLDIREGTQPQLFAARWFAADATGWSPHPVING